MTGIDRRGFVAGAGAGTLLAASGLRTAAAQVGTNPTGAWSPVYPWPDVGIHLTVLPNHKILSFSDDGVKGLRDRNADFSQAFVVDIPLDSAPLTTSVQVGNKVVRIDNNVTNLFCAGHAFLPDGRLLVLGGHEGINYFGSVDTTTFEYQNGYRWVRQNAPMNAGRWYASAVTLANGEVLVLSGAVDGSNRQNTLPQVWRTNEGGGWRNLTSAALKLPNYPKIYVAPDGRVISIGPERLTRFLNTSDAGAWTPGPATRHPLKRVYGTSVMYGDGKFLVVGGSDKVGTPPTNTCETLDLNTPAPAWQWTNSLSFARKHCNATLLPDGKVLVTGGSNSVAFNDAAGAIFAAELWDPATGQWTRMSSARVPRIYHSSAVLLPDARVLVAGGGRPKAKNGGLNNTNCELFWPPYFGRGPRPVIWSAPPVVNYGQQFNIITPDVANVAHVRLLSYGTTTHTFNMSQRLKSLAFSRVPTETRLQVLMETNRNLLPPGYYMLFLLNQLEVPSFAWSIRVT